MIEIQILNNEINPSISIKREYQFKINNILYKDACHKMILSKEYKNGNN